MDNVDLPVADAPTLETLGTAGPGKHQHPTHEEIAVEAYYEWEDRVAAGGDYFGEAVEDWLVAEQIVEKNCGEENS
jgi:hypothetical protein